MSFFQQERVTMMLQIPANMAKTSFISIISNTKVTYYGYKYSHFAIEFLTLCLLKSFVYIKAVWIKLEIILIILDAAFNFTRSIFLLIFNLSFCFKYSSTPGISLTGTDNNLWSGFSFFRGNTLYIYFMSRLSPPD